MNTVKGPNDPIDWNKTIKVERTPPPARIEVRVLPSGFTGEEKGFVMEMDAAVYRMLATKLPKDREIDWKEAERGQKQSDERRQVIDMLAREIAGRLTKMVESQDTVQGYSREEWERMHGR